MATGLVDYLLIVPAGFEEGYLAAARDGGCDPVVVVTGHAAPAVRAAIGEAPVPFVHNGDFAEGGSTSLKASIAALPGEPARRPYEIAMKCWDKGFYVRYGGDTIQLAPPFISTPAEIDRLVSALGDALAETA